MKIIQVNAIYDTGSTGKIVKELHSFYLKQGFDSYVLYGHGIKSNGNCIKVCSKPYTKFQALLAKINGMPYGGCFFSTKRIINFIKKNNPDIVHLHCLNSHVVNIFKLISWLNANKIRTILTLHAEFMHTANCPHAYECEKWKTGCGNCERFRSENKTWFFDRTHHAWVKMKESFEGFQYLTVVSVSPWLSNRAKQSPILADKNHIVIFNGVNGDVFHHRETDIREKFNIKGKYIFHATPSFNHNINDLKGGYYVIEIAKKMPEYTFVVAGPYGIVEKPKNLILLGEILDQEILSQLYSAAELTLITSKRETFSMVLAESLCSGTPVAGFYAGAPETIAIENYCEFAPFGETDSLIQKIKLIFSKEYDKKKISDLAIQKFSNSRMCQEYLEAYQDLINKK